MYLFILESFGTSELILIGIVALIIFGPRKLPQMAKTIGKTIADFKKTTYEFKTTWEKEVNFEEIEMEAKNLTSELNPVENTAESHLKQISEKNTILSPEIKEISSYEAEKLLALKDKSATAEETHSETRENDKRSWL